MELPVKEDNGIQCHFKLKLKANNNMQGICNNGIIQQKIKTATAAIGKNQNPISRRKSKWKLKFHHQALPPEYLNHYEASLLQTATSVAVPLSSFSSTAATTTPRPIAPAAVPTVSLQQTANTAVAGTNIISARNKPLSNDIRTTENKVPPLNSNSQTERSKNSNNNNNNNNYNNNYHQSTVRYDDLPYMGEMTLDNARPRRGRKPKKADICHLIYKNYGTTTIVDEPLNLCLRDLKNRVTSVNTAVTTAAAAVVNAISNTVADHHISMRKFKFTAGAVPSLQERKILSVDSVSNGRTSTKLVDNRQSRDGSNHSNLINHRHHHYHHQNRRKEIKRKTRKSLAREKLEKTFKEKGFLIQTQQLESAQGATYCKFRQLKKFTRYLFRSWKNHLPGDVINNNAS